MTKEEKQKRFIEKAIKKYNGKFDYSKIDYVDTTTPVCIICPEHGEFWQKPCHHLVIAHGCPQCAKDAITKDAFIKKANLKYNNKFDYSKVEYVDSLTPVCIICPEHGEFWTSPQSHLNKKTKYGCPVCGAEISKSKIKACSNEKFIEKARKVHGDKYDYSKVHYVDSQTKVCIICPIHGEFWQKPSNHLTGRGCAKCGKQKMGLTKEKFITRAKELYGNRYDYSCIDNFISYKGITIFDNEKQTFFIQTPKNHLKGEGYTEYNIFEWYKENNKLYDYYYNIAKKYTDLYDLYLNHKKIFYNARKNGWIKDYIWLKNNNEKKIRNSFVYAYEFSDHSVYVGLTNSLLRRDRQHRERKYHSNGKPMYDGVLDYSEKHNIVIPEVKILSKHLTKDESGDEEIKWIKMYKDNGWNLINKNNGGATGSGIINKSRWTHETVIEEAKKYKNMEEMYKKNHSAYKYMERHKIKLLCFPNAKLQVHNQNRIYTKELIEETVKKCPHKTDLRNLDMTMYQYLFKHGLLYDYYPKGRHTNSNYGK
jgi:hypothetical protein